MTRRIAARMLIAGSLVTGGLVATAPPASADFHFMMIREVGAGHPIEIGAEFVVLQMFSSDQTNLSPGHSLRVYGSGGNQVKNFAIPNDVTNGQDQATILFANADAEIAYGVQADFQDEFNIDSSGGAVCFDMIDCVAWGTFNNMVAGNLPVGTPEAGAIPRSVSPSNARPLPDARPPWTLQTIRTTVTPISRTRHRRRPGTTA